MTSMRRSGCFPPMRSWRRCSSVRRRSSMERPAPAARSPSGNRRCWRRLAWSSRASGRPAPESCADRARRRAARFVTCMRGRGSLRMSGRWLSRCRVRVPDARHRLRVAGFAGCAIESARSCGGIGARRRYRGWRVLAGRLRSCALPLPTARREGQRWRAAGPDVPWRRRSRAV